MKQCPQCNSSCEDQANVCTNCGYIFPPKGFEQEFSNNSSVPNQNQPNNSYQQQSYSAPFQNNNNFSYNNGSQPPKNNGMSIASLVLGICATVFGCCYTIGFFPGVVAVILGFISNATINKSNGSQKGKTYAIIGIVLGFIGIALAIFFAVWLYLNREEFFSVFNDMMNRYY